MSPQPGLTIAKIAMGGHGARRFGFRWKRLVGLGLLFSLLLVSCRTASPPAPSTPPAPPTEPAPPVDPPPTPEPPVGQPPNTTPPVQSNPLPDALVQQWEPMSNVLLVFGPMTITSGDITWESGQTSPYTLVSTEDGFLLRLEANPSFYDINHPYVKLIPNTDGSGSITTVEVAFYESEAQARRDEYMMYGTYFVN